MGGSGGLESVYPLHPGEFIDIFSVWRGVKEESV